MEQLLETQRTDLRKHEHFHSELLEDDRDLIVYVPEGYEEDAGKRYPVLYLQDGQNLFDPETSFGGVDWKVDKTAEMLIAHRAIRPLIVVGIYNTGEQRVSEYTPTRDPKHGGGFADLYGGMLTEEIKPFIDGQYRTQQSAHHTAVGGSSLGGLVSLYLGLQYSGVFGKLAVMSPSVWWNKRAIVKFLDEFDAKPDLRIWLDIGTAEGAKAVSDARRLRDKLMGLGFAQGEDLMYCEAQGAKHTEAAWAERVGPMLQYLFPVDETVRPGCPGDV